MPSKRSPRSSVAATRERPRTRSVAQREQTEQSPTEEAGATSDVNNDGGSPSSNESPSSHRKKPRHVTQCEITEEPPAPPQLPAVEEEERVVHFFSQYLCLRLWRAIERCEVWDSRLVKAALEGPRSFADSINAAVRRMQRRWSGPVEAENATRAYLERLRPKGLYDCCARIFKRAPRKINRPLKRKTMEDVPERFSMFEGEKSTEKFKHRFLMAEPRLTILSGPKKTESDADVVMGQ